MFYDHDWNQIGHKHALGDLLESITNIPRIVLAGWNPLRYPIAERMRWASRRHTTRTEDMAYCLMGLFDVNMPLLYGEGIKSFRRLQEEIIRSTNEDSILAWTAADTTSRLYHGPLAPSPACFTQRGLWRYSSFEPLSVSSRGVQTLAYLQPHPKHQGLYGAVLECANDKDQDIHPSIWLLHTPDLHTTRFGEAPLKVVDGDLFVRVLASRMSSQHYPQWGTSNYVRRRIVIKDVSSRPISSAWPDVDLEITIGIEPASIVSSLYNTERSAFVRSSPGKLACFVYELVSGWCIIVVGISSFGKAWSKGYIPQELQHDTQRGRVNHDCARTWGEKYGTEDDNRPRTSVLDRDFKVGAHLQFDCDFSYISVTLPEWVAQKLKSADREP